MIIGCFKFLSLKTNFKNKVFYFHEYRTILFAYHIIPHFIISDEVWPTIFPKIAVTALKSLFLFATPLQPLSKLTIAHYAFRTQRARISFYVGPVIGLFATCYLCTTNALNDLIS